MADIREFPGAKRPQQANQRPAHGGYPAVTLKVDVTDAMRQLAASQLVVKTLQFYAGQGYDHGEMARRALLAMQQATSQAANQPN